MTLSVNSIVALFHKPLHGTMPPSLTTSRPPAQPPLFQPGGSNPLIPLRQVFDHYSTTGAFGDTILLIYPGRFGINMDFRQMLANATPDQETVLTIGVFDGVHLGHCHLLQLLVTLAGSEYLPTVITFTIPPPYLGQIFKSNTSPLRPEKSG